MMAQRTLRTLTSILALASCLTACGGGGGGPSFGGGISGSGKPGTRVGVIEQDGTVIVDGVTFGTSSAAITVSGTSTPVTSVRAGMVATVTGLIDGTAGTAQTVVIEEVIKGMVTSKIDGSTMLVLGQMVEVNLETVYESGISPASLDGIQVGDFVEIYGYFKSTGVIAATRIERESSLSELRVVGAVENVNLLAMTFDIGAQSVDYSTADTTDLLGGVPVIGQIVEVRGDPPLGGAGELIATRVKLADDGTPDNSEDASVEGFVTSIVSANEFVVGTQLVQVNGSTVYEGGTLLDVVVGTKIEAEGAMVGGILVADKIEFGDPVKLESDIATAAGNTITLVGLPGISITVNAATEYEGDASSFADLAPGDHVEIRGTVTGATTMVATSVDEDSANSDVILQGPIDAAPAPSDPTFSILGIVVDTSALVDNDFQNATESIIGRATFFTSASPTTLVKASGTLSGSVVTWDEVQLEE